MQSMKETAANIGASAKAGMEKTKAVVQEKVEKVSAHNPVQKEMAKEKKEQRIAEAEAMKHSAKAHNAAAKQGGQVLGADYTTGSTDYITPGHHQGYSTGATDYITPGHHHGTGGATAGGAGYGTIGDYGTTGGLAAAPFETDCGGGGICFGVGVADDDLFMIWETALYPPGTQC
uniref:Putative seed maturation protein n=1 Tax=Linum usitatissimum TaxID=4006 RepID=I6YM58_LINUS|nr:putative seed maturation protein [Linum usitatissimum]